MEESRTDAGGVPAKLAPGQIVATPGALSTISQNEVLNAIARHVAGDWGDLDREDWKANDEALEHGGRLLSAYHSSTGVKFWIITEADRSVTTVLLPEEY